MPQKWNVMIQDAINTLIDIQQKYQDLESIEVFSNKTILIHYNDFSLDGDDYKLCVEWVKDAQEMLEWMEANLTKIK